MMWIYMAIPLTCCGLHLISNRIGSKKHLYFIPTVMLILLAGLRHFSVGVDIPGYCEKFIQISKCEWGNLFLENQNFSHYEAGFIVLDKFISYVTTDKQVYLFIMAILVYLPVCIFYYKYADHSFLALCLYFCIPSFIILFSGLRQALATSLTIVSFNYIKEKKPIKFLFLIICAFFFHRTSICFLFAYPLYHLNLAREKYPIVFILLVLIFLIRTYLLEYIFDLSVFIDDKYESYEIGNTNSYAMIAFYLLLLIFSLTFCKDTKKLICLRNLLLMVIVFQFFASIQSNAARLGYYYLMFLPMYIVQCFEDLNFDKIGEKRLIIFIIMLAFVIVGWRFINGPHNMQLQYKFWRG